MRATQAIRRFTLFSFCSQLDFYVPIKVVYFHLITGSYATASIIISLVWIAQALLEIPTGLFSDYSGCKRTIVLGALLSALAYVLYAWNAAYWLLCLGSVLEGGSRSLFSGNNTAYLHDLLAGEQQERTYHHAYGRLNAVIGVAMFLAGLGSGVLIQEALHLFMWLNLAPQLVALALALSLAETTRHERAPNLYAHLKEAFAEIRGNLNLCSLSLSQMLGGGLASYEYQAAVYAAVWPTWAIGLARAIQEAGVVPSFYFTGRPSWATLCSTPRCEPLEQPCSFGGSPGRLVEWWILRPEGRRTCLSRPSPLLFPPPCMMRCNNVPGSITGRWRRRQHSRCSPPSVQLRRSHRISPPDSMPCLSWTMRRSSVSATASLRSRMASSLMRWSINAGASTLAPMKSSCWPR
jgi:MFS family permease